MIKNKLFKERLLEQIRISGKSVNQIEKELGYPRNALNNYKNGGEPSGSRLIEIANYFNVSPEYMIGKITTFENMSIKKIFDSMKASQKLEIGEMYQKWLVSYIKFQKKSNKENNKKITHKSKNTKDIMM